MLHPCLIPGLVDSGGPAWPSDHLMLATGPPCKNGVPNHADGYLPLYMMGIQYRIDSFDPGTDTFAKTSSGNLTDSHGKWMKVAHL